SIALPKRGAVADVAVLQVKQDHGVASKRAKPADLARRKVRPEVHFRVTIAVEVLEVVDNRAIVKLAQEQRGTEARVPHDQVGPDVRPSRERLVNSVCVPCGILESAAAIMVVRCGTTLGAVLDALDGAEATSRLSRDERAAEVVSPR